MGARGPLKMPTHLRAVGDGDQGVSAADSARREAPAKPRSVADEEQLSELWDQIVPVLDSMGMIAPSDGPTLELALRAYRNALRADAEITQIAVDDTGHNGGLKKHPAEAVFRMESELFLKFAQMLGMTWVSRARTPGPKGRDDGDANPFEAPAASS